MGRPGGNVMRRLVLVLVSALVAVSCSGDDRVSLDEVPSSPDEVPSSPSATAAEMGDTVVGPRADIVIDANDASLPIDPRLFGTNVPAWAGPGNLADPGYRASAVDMGVTLLRMPGGSWSNAYDWLGCEQRDEDRCFWPWAARPTDFIGFMNATGIAGSWTVNVNETAEAAAAAVAFFNGDPSDTRSIGTDRNGVDWGTVAKWAQLRVDNGNPEPAEIGLWEVGNEVYGGRPDAGGERCADFGWEDVWTCDGTEYVLGDEDHDGYLAIRKAMIAVDPDVQVGAVGVAPPSEWGGFGEEVIAASGDDLDFYVVHGYGFDRSPSGDEALRRPAELWPRLIASVRGELGPDVPIAVTEYNLVAFEGGDTEQSMTTAQNALFIADTIGQFAVGGVAIGNQWNLANGRTNSGTDYGLVDAETYDPYPQGEAMRAWSAVGSDLLPATVDGDLHVYPTRHDDGRLTVIVINLGDEAVTPTLQIVSDAGSLGGTLDTVSADELDATELTPSESVALPALDTPTTVSFPAWSISRLELAPPT